ncbi:HAD family hydrolase [Agriterribacter humi]|uniref:HAD family hydrolase n=1 Tax=Agriterribacter humi TaxID=1104781 RepID=UPI0012659CCD|nr:HAD family hydrolase [Agriterribacter humi]
MIKAVFFDVANTLLYKPDLFNRIGDVLKKNGYTVKQNSLIQKHKLLSEVFAFPDKTSKEFYTSFNTELLYLLGIPANETLVREIFEACSYLPWQPFEDTPFIQTIQQPVGVLSNWDDTLPGKLKEHFAFPFSWILGSQLKGVRKPDPAFFTMMIESAACDPKEILYVGDSLKLDIAPALQAGINAVLIDRADIFENSPVKRITNLAQLEKYL